MAADPRLWSLAGAVTVICTVAAPAQAAINPDAEVATAVFRRQVTDIAATPAGAEANPGDARAQRDVLRSIFRLAGVPHSGITWTMVVAEMESQRQRGLLAGSDLKFLDAVRAYAAKESGDTP